MYIHGLSFGGSAPSNVCTAPVNTMVFSACVYNNESSKLIPNTFNAFVYLYIASWQSCKRRGGHLEDTATCEFVLLTSANMCLMTFSLSSMLFICVYCLYVAMYYQH